MDSDEAETKLLPNSNNVYAALNKQVGVKRRNRITVQQKKEICQYKHEHPNAYAREIFLHFRNKWPNVVAPSTISKILMSEHKWLSQHHQNSNRKTCTRIYQPRNVPLEEALYKWYLGSKDKVSISNEMLKQKALALAKELKMHRFSCSNNWIYSFKKRHDLLKYTHRAGAGTSFLNIDLDYPYDMQEPASVSEKIRYLEDDAGNGTIYVTAPITSDEARHGLICTMAYLAAHSNVSRDYIDQLWNIFQQIADESSIGVLPQSVGCSTEEDEFGLIGEESTSDCQQDNVEVLLSGKASPTPQGETLANLSDCQIEKLDVGKSCDTSAPRAQILMSTDPSDFGNIQLAVQGASGEYLYVTAEGDEHGECLDISESLPQILQAAGHSLEDGSQFVETIDEHSGLRTITKHLPETPEKTVTEVLCQSEDGGSSTCLSNTTNVCSDHAYVSTAADQSAGPVSEAMTAECDILTGKEQHDTEDKCSKDGLDRSHVDDIMRKGSIDDAENVDRTSEKGKTVDMKTDCIDHIDKISADASEKESGSLVRAGEKLDISGDQSPEPFSHSPAEPSCEMSAAEQCVPSPAVSIKSCFVKLRRLPEASRNASERSVSQKKVEEVFSSDSCSEMVSSVDSLKSRRTRGHFEGPQQKEKQSRVAKDNYPCSTCGKVFSRKSSFVCHLRWHNNECSCIACKGSKGTVNHHHITDDAKDQSKNTHPDVMDSGLDKMDMKPLLCNLCGVCFVRDVDLEVHKKTHAEGNDWTCLTCKRRFARSADLKRHRRVHLLPTELSCKTCGKDFVNRSNLSKHKRLHTGLQDYDCSLCGKCFENSADLKKHRKLHQRTRSNQCAVCGQTFVLERNLNVHMLLHHESERTLVAQSPRQKRRTCARNGSLSHAGISAHKQMASDKKQSSVNVH